MGKMTIAPKNFMVTFSGSINWSGAQTLAHDLGGELASIESAAENNLLVRMDHNNDLWIGGLQSDNLAEPAGHWTWADGEPFAFTNWSGGVPDNSGGNEDFAEMYYYGPWNDLPGSANLSAVAIEFSTNNFVGSGYNDMIEVPQGGATIDAGA